MDAFVRVVEFKHLQESGGEAWIMKWAEDKIGGIKQACILTNLHHSLSVTCESQIKHWQAEAASALGLRWLLKPLSCATSESLGFTLKFIDAIS